jgi:ferredoxin
MASIKTLSEIKQKIKNSKAIVLTVQELIYRVSDGETAIERSRCFNCGNCARLCPKAFKLDLKSIRFEGKKVPVVLRQSDRDGAIKIAEELKSMILTGKFPLEKPTGKLDFARIIK